MKKRYKKILPLRKKCDCGKRVLNHHWLCDKCYSKKARENNKKKSREFFRKIYK